MIVHICQRQKWEEAIKQGLYESETLAEDGFIHASYAEQIIRVANKYFRSYPDLLVLWIDQNKVMCEIREEFGLPNENNELFPHIYGSLNLDAVISVQDFKPDSDGVFRHLPTE